MVVLVLELLVVVVVLVLELLVEYIHKQNYSVRLFDHMFLRYHSHTFPKDHNLYMIVRVMFHILEVVVGAEEQ